MIKNKKILLSLIFTIIFSVALVGCGGSDNGQSSGSDNGEALEVVGLEEAFASEPIVLTSVGQSADVEMVKALMDNAGLDYTMDKLLTKDGLEGANTLVLAIGGSSKGLGAAGINADDELARTQEVIDAAKENGMSIIAMHIGGENRRGELSDRFIEPSCKDADYIIIVESGNSDGIFTNIASRNNIPMEVVQSIANAMEPLQKAFK